MRFASLVLLLASFYLCRGKECVGGVVDPKNLVPFTGCVTINGDLTFKRSDYSGADLVRAFDALRTINGRLQVIESNFEYRISTLDFLKDLVEIKSDKEGPAMSIILNKGLKSLGLKNILRISSTGKLPDQCLIEIDDDLVKTYADVKNNRDDIIKEMEWLGQKAHNRLCIYNTRTPGVKKEIRDPKETGQLVVFSVVSLIITLVIVAIVLAVECIVQPRRNRHQKRPIFGFWKPHEACAKFYETQKVLGKLLEKDAKKQAADLAAPKKEKSKPTENATKGSTNNTPATTKSTEKTTATRSPSTQTPVKDKSTPGKDKSTPQKDKPPTTTAKDAKEAKTPKTDATNEMKTPAARTPKATKNENNSPVDTKTPKAATETKTPKDRKNGGKTDSEKSKKFHKSKTPHAVEPTPPAEASGFPKQAMMPVPVEQKTRSEETDAVSRDGKSIFTGAEVPPGEFPQKKNDQKPPQRSSKSVKDKNKKSVDEVNVVENQPHKKDEAEKREKKHKKEHSSEEHKDHHNKPEKKNKSNEAKRNKSNEEKDHHKDRHKAEKDKHGHHEKDHKSKKRHDEHHKAKKKH